MCYPLSGTSRSPICPLDSSPDDAHPHHTQEEPQEERKPGSPLWLLQDLRFCDEVEEASPVLPP